MGNNLLPQLAEECGISLTGEMLEKFVLYERLLLEWNKKINLTAITDPEGIAAKHFLDSLTILRAYAIPPNASIIDIGTGAGFPGVPLKIVRPDLRLTLLDSLGKRITFLRELSNVLGQHNNFYHDRAEQAAHKRHLREVFDIATARAVSALPVLCEYCLPFVRTGGAFLAMKGPDCIRELDSARSAISLLGGEIGEVRDFHLPIAGKRTIIILRKSSQTPTKYPRTPAQITKAPL